MYNYLVKINFSFKPLEGERATGTRVLKLSKKNVLDSAQAVMVRENMSFTNVLTMFSL